MSEVAKYYVTNQGPDPLTESEVRRRILSGQIKQDSYVYSEGDTNWVPITESVFGNPKEGAKEKKSLYSPFVTWVGGDAKGAVVQPNPSQHVDGERNDKMVVEVPPKGSIFCYVLALVSFIVVIFGVPKSFGLLSGPAVLIIGILCPMWIVCGIVISYLARIAQDLDSKK